MSTSERSARHMHAYKVGTVHMHIIRVLPSCISKSVAKYSIKKMVSCFNACPYNVCNIACPVRSAAHAVR